MMMTPNQPNAIVKRGRRTPLLNGVGGSSGGGSLAWYDHGALLAAQGVDHWYDPRNRADNTVGSKLANVEDDADADNVRLTTLRDLIGTSDLGTNGSGPYLSFGGDDITVNGQQFWSNAGENTNTVTGPVGIYAMCIQTYGNRLAEAPYSQANTDAWGVAGGGNSADSQFIFTAASGTNTTLIDDCDHGYIDQDEVETGSLLNRGDCYTASQGRLTVHSFRNETAGEGSAEFDYLGRTSSGGNMSAHGAIAIWDSEPTEEQVLAVAALFNSEDYANVNP